MSKLFINKVLDQDRIVVLTKLKPFFSDFALAGGTGLAFYFGHRTSYDFDLFSEDPIPRFFAKKVFESITPRNITVNNKDELTFFSTSNIKTTFLYYPFPKLEEHYHEDGITVASLNDLIANKLFVIGQRAEIRDYIDIHRSLTEYSLDYCIDITEKKYHTHFDKKLMLGQLAYFNDLDFSDPIFLSYGVPEVQFKDDLTQAVTNYIQK